MPLYLVRWPTLMASLVQADDEDDLLDILDQDDDPGGCTFEVYSGPLWIDFDIPFKIGARKPENSVPTDPSDFTVEPTSDFRGELGPDMVRVTTPLCDEVSDMKMEVLRGAFPELAEHIEAHELDEDRTAAWSDDGLGAALLDELWPLVRYHQALGVLADRDKWSHPAASTPPPCVATIIGQRERKLVEQLFAEGDDGDEGISKLSPEELLSLCALDPALAELEDDAADGPRP